jgi:hypothetical protein
MKIHFDTPAERRQHHRYISETAREIETETRLLEALFILENGVQEHNNGGFGFVEVNDPESSSVPFPDMSADFLDEVASTLSGATAADLGADLDDEQLQTLAANLSDTAEAIRSSIDTDA